MPAHIIPRSVYSLSYCPPKDNHQPLARHFSSAFQSTYLAMRHHSTGASTPPWQCTESTAIQSRNSQSSRNILHLCQQSPCQVSMDTRQGEDLRNHRRPGHIEGHLCVQARLKDRVVPQSPQLQINTSVFLPLSVVEICSSPRTACVHNSLSSRHQRASVSIYMVPFHHGACPPRRSCTIWRARSTVRSHGTHQGPSQAWRPAFFRNTRRRIYHASGARHSPLNRLSNQCATS